ncbi:MAG: Hpt domain-containing protein [Magnetococcales bacterium]|nr:Hpt domain-containing protein [Magnetococcales bacterium]
MVEPDRISVIIDRDLELIMPGYLANRQNDLLQISKALQDGDFISIQTIGHRMKGSGSGYGLDEITELGREMEVLAKAHNKEDITKLATKLANYLQRIDIVFKEL